MDSLTIDNVSYCFAKVGEVYAVYSESGVDKIKLEVGVSDKTFTVSWFEPRNGSDLQNGSTHIVKAEGVVDLGIPPSNPYKDWVILVKVK